MPLQLEEITPSRSGRAEPDEEGQGTAIVHQFGQPAPVRDRVRITVGPAPSATPLELQLGTLAHSRLQVRRPFMLKVGRENEHVTVWNADIEEIGYGPDLSAAIGDFQQAVIELYMSLCSDQDRLGPDMTRLWKALQGFVVERP